MQGAGASKRHYCHEPELKVNKGQSITIIKYAANLSSQNHPVNELLGDKLKSTLARISEKGFETMLAEQAAAWAKKWERNDIIIEGDAAAQQGNPV